MKENYKITYCLMVMLLIRLAGIGQTIQNSQPPIPLDPDVKLGKLPNGFTYYIRKNAEPANRVVIYLVNKVGSVLETEEQRGLAHFLEHMAFNGTKHFPKHELVSYLQQAGVRFGADLNAYTGFDETVYQLPIASDNPELMKNALQIMRDWAQDLTLEPAEIDKERGIVLEERRGRLGANQRMSDKLLPVLFNQSRYADRVPIGTEQVLKNFKYETLRQFYETWYRPDLQALIIVGDVNVKAIEKMVLAKFSNLKSPKPLQPRINYPMPLLNKTQFAVMTDPEAPGMNIEVHFKQLTGNAKDETFFRRKIMQALFTDMLTARFSELGQQDNIPFTRIDGRISPMQAGVEALSASVQPKPGKEQEAFKVLWTELERIKQHGFTASELNRANVNMLSQLESLYKERNNIPSQRFVQEYVQHFLREEPCPGIEYEYSLHKTMMPTITVEAMNNYFKDWFSSRDRDLVITANDKDREALPSETAVEQWINTVSKETVPAYVDKGNNNTLMAAKPVPGKVVSEKKLPKTDITELVLSNGVKVLLKPTNFKKDEVLFSASSPGGTSVVSDDNFHAASMIPVIIAASGVDNFNATALQKLLAGKNIFVSPTISELYEGLNGQSTSKDLETALQLINLYFTKPRKDVVAFNNFISRISQDFSNSSSIPDQVFQDTIMAASSGYHFRSRKPTPEQLKAIDPDKVLQLYKERFADASDFTFVFVGNFEPETFKPMLELYLGSLPSLNRKEQWKDRKTDEINGYVSRKVFKGKESKAQVFLSFGGEMSPAFPIEEQVSLFTLCEVVQFRLVARLREEESGIYNVRVIPVPQKYPTAKYSIKIIFSCDPANVELLVLAVHTEFDKLRKEGVEAEDMNKVHSQSKLGLEQAFRVNNYWLSTLMKRLANDNDPDEILSIKKMVQAVTASDIQKAANRFLNTENYMRFVLLPE